MSDIHLCFYDRCGVCVKRPLEARLAEVEAERDHWKEAAAVYDREAELNGRAEQAAEARLAEVEAENDGLRHVIEHGVKGNATRLTDLKAAQARLAEMTREAQLSRGATERAVARLAEVEATIEACGCNSEAGWEADAEFKAMKARLAAVVRVRDWMGQNNDDAEYDLAIVALNNALGEGDDRG